VIKERNLNMSRIVGRKIQSDLNDWNSISIFGRESASGRRREGNHVAGIWPTRPQLRYGSCTHLQRHVISWQWQISDEKSNSRRRREKLANMAAHCFREMNFEDRGANSFFIFAFCGQLLRICVGHYSQIGSAITKKLIAVANLQIWPRNFTVPYIWVF